MTDLSTKALFGMTRLQLSERFGHLSAELRDLPTIGDVPTTRIDNWCWARRKVLWLIGTPTSHPTISDGRPHFSGEHYFLDLDRHVARCFTCWHSLGEQVDPSHWDQHFPRQQ